VNFLFLAPNTRDINEAILSLLRCYSLPSVILTRLKTVLLADQTHNKEQIAGEIGTRYNFVKKWVSRAEQLFSTWPTKAMEMKEIQALLLSAFSDEPRSGSPAKYNAEQCCNVMALALKKPVECGKEITQWTHIELADEVNKQKIAEGMSKSTVGRLLRQADIRPHKSRYWLNPNIDDEETFKKEVKNICDTYHEAPLLAKENVFTVSVDEKTGIQALERISPTRYMLPGSVEKREFEYKRHGTLCLTPSFNIVTGKIISHTIDETRDEIDFYEHIRNTVETSPNSTWIFVADQLTTHKSESLVRYIAEQCGIQGDLGVKRKRGILENVASRQAFLTDASHRIRFVFTPKHCSWLNQVEIWFGILSRKLINRGSFISKDDLRGKLNRFIVHFNENLAKPYQWTYKGKALAA